jgi:hypothetical protein
MDKHKIATSALIGVGAFFLISVVLLTVQDQYTDFGDPRLHVAGAIQTNSGQVITVLSLAAIGVGVKFRKAKVKTAPA